MFKLPSKFSKIKKFHRTCTNLTHLTQLTRLKKTKQIYHTTEKKFKTYMYRKSKSISATEQIQLVHNISHYVKT